MRNEFLRINISPHNMLFGSIVLKEIRVFIDRLMIIVIKLKTFNLGH